MARARQSSCRWPCDRLRPPSETGELRLSKMLVFLGLEAVVVVVPDVSVELERRCTRSRQSRSAASVCWLNGSRLLRMVPEKRVGSWRKKSAYLSLADIETPSFAYLWNDGEARSQVAQFKLRDVQTVDVNAP